ncbi:MAG: FG-GAP repeat protein, partial [Chloroflexota bacterium]
MKINRLSEQVNLVQRFGQRQVLFKWIPFLLLGFGILFLVTAVYAKTISETFKVIPSDVDTDDQFGFSVSISGNTIISGARFDEDLGDEAGAAYQIDAATGNTVRKILAFDPPTDDELFGNQDDIFGESVATNGNIAVIGAPRKSQAGQFAGAVYVFDTTRRRLITRLLPFAPIINDPTAGFFGFSVAASDNFIVVGAPADVEQNSGAGAAYIYTTGNNPQIIDKIYAGDPGFADNFGRRVAVSNTTAAIAAPFDDDNGSDSGSVYLFDAATAQQIVKIIPDDGAAGDFFGIGIAVGERAVAVGAPFADTNGADSGAVYLFDAATGQQITKITPDDASAGARFGESVAVDGNNLLVGAPLDSGVGAAYIFDLASGLQRTKLVASDGQSRDGFGGSVSLSGANAVIGAAGDDDAGSLSGSIYIFNLNGPAATPTATTLPPTGTSTPVPPPPTATPIPPTPSPTPEPGSSPLIYLSSTSGGSIGGVSFSDEDILLFDTGSSTWSLFFDGSDVGLNNTAALDIDGFYIQPDGSILLSTTAAGTISGVGQVDDSDILLFKPTSLGPNTAGTFSLYFDGSDVSLTSNGEDIDAISLDSDGNLIVSTLGRSNVGFRAADEDLLRFEATSLGANTSGVWTPYFDGSDIGLNGSNDEDVFGISVDGKDLFLTTRGPFSAAGINGGNADILLCAGAITGAASSCGASSLFFDG